MVLPVVADRVQQNSYLRQKKKKLASGLDIQFPAC